MLKQMIQFVAQQMMDMDAESLCAAAYGEPGAAEQPQWLPRTTVGYTRRLGRAEDPEAAQRQLFPGFREPRRTAEKALAAVIQEAEIPSSADPQHQSAGAAQRKIKRRTNFVGIFPHEAAITRLVGALLLEQNDGWQLHRRYLPLEGLQSLAENQTARLSSVVN